MTYDGSQSVASAGTRVPLLTAGTYAPCFTITVQAIKSGGTANTGLVFLGGKTVSSTRGLVLNPGDFFTFPPMESNAYEVTDVYIDAANNGDGVCFIYSVR